MSAQAAFVSIGSLPPPRTEETPVRRETIVSTRTSSAVIAIASASKEPSLWLPTPANQRPTPSLRKGLLFGAVIAAHVAVALVLSQINSNEQKTNNEPMQVVMVMDTHSQQTTPPPPMPVLKLPEMALPLEPVIDIAEPAPQAISVVAMIAPPAQSMESTSAQPKLVSAVEYVRAPTVKYPAAARALKQRGIVTVRVLIDEAGNPRDVQVQKTSGSRLLDEAALSAVLKALFKPKTENGNPVAVYALVPIEFTAA